MVNGVKRLRALVDEEWREVPGSQGRYLVSSYGRVKSFAIDKDKGQFLKCTVLKGYKYLTLKLNKKRNMFFIHKLVALVWLPRPSERHTVVTHLDRNLSNNHYTNLAWLTPHEAYKRNGEYYKKIFTGVTPPDERHNTKLKERDIIQLKKMLQLGVPQVKIAKMFCISEMQVTRIKRGENWGDVKLPAKET
jgi:hypothetical protein